MNIKDIFGDEIEVTDLNAAIEQANMCVGLSHSAWKQSGGYPNVKFTERNGVTHTLLAYHSHNLRELIKLWPPIQYPEWLFVGAFTTCYVYCDTRKEVKGDYKEILRLFYNPLRIEITSANKKAYPEVLELAKEQLKQLQMRCNEPLEISATGQTTHISIREGADVIITK
jgi:hypothetical protein